MSSELLNTPVDEGLTLENGSRSRNVRLLFIADIVGQPGIDILTLALPNLIREQKPDLVIAKGENADNGRGMTVQQVNLFHEIGIDVITSGNHIWDKAPLRKEFKKLPNLLRPINYPPGSGGRGSVVVRTKSDIPIKVFNLQGRTFLPPIDCPFRTMDSYLNKHEEDVKIIFIDFHAETTAEKQAMGWYLDGKVSAIVGTHTHVPTADERILPKGTGYITDVGMTGSFDSVIGMETKVALRRFLTNTPQPFQVAEKNLHVCAVIVDVDKETGKCVSIERINYS